MKTLSFENSDETYINMFLQCNVIKVLEYSAIFLSERFDYKLLLGVDNKRDFVYLIVWFPLSKKMEIIKKLKVDGYWVKLITKDLYTEIETGEKSLEKNKENLIKIKQEKIKFSLC